ncbi:MAG TPA: hypothetical protein VHW43_10425 [Puia sp.]|jgi:hypothetical protein|nr:hypothetical protein [Puia sp.]
MEKYISGMPTWAIVVFIAGFLYSISFIANPAKRAGLAAGMTPVGARNVQFGIFGFYVLYLAYASVLALKGVFYTTSVPPTVIVFAALPLMIILFIVVANTKLFKTLLRSVTLESLIALHVFRLLGVFFLLLTIYKLLPLDFGISGGAGDIITAIFAIPLARRVAKKKPGSLTLVYIWNIFGALDIINIMVLAVIGAKNAAATGNQGSMEMTIFPFVWLPAFAPATILFLHYMIFRKLRQDAHSNRSH